MINVAPSEEVKKFCEGLTTAVGDVPAHNFLAILGDFNPRIGPEEEPFPFHTLTNRNGTDLNALLIEHNLLDTNTTFWKMTGKAAKATSQQTGAVGNKRVGSGHKDFQYDICGNTKEGHGKSRN